jgi:hypothetical protein
VQFGRPVAVQLDLEHGASHTSFISATIDTERTESERPAPPITHADEALFEEARRRARRRRRRQATALAGILALAAIAAAIVLGTPRAGRPARERPIAPTAVSPQRVLAQAPYMGVSCRQPNSIACGRVGLAVWTRRPARTVRATVAGHQLELDDPMWSGDRVHGLRRMFAGFVLHAGLHGSGPLAVRVKKGSSFWEGDPPVSTDVRLLITYADGSQQATVVRVQLSPGWG